MSDNIRIVEEFVAAWSSLDAARLAGYFCDDGSYHNMPSQPVTGKENVEKFIEQFLSNWTETDWDIINITEQGETVFCERLDRTKTQRGNVDLPCFGVFEMEGGKIKVWRDYFDLGTFTKAMV
ncbi:MAG TPA: SgcJ/EcaC family oxidoreductase [Gammaproteobacteria bacterium]|nr:SgcJ/EcaC family oxidoreductase [Gammaproteobacteria bacterium]